MDNNISINIYLILYKPLLNLSAIERFSISISAPCAEMQKFVSRYFSKTYSLELHEQKLGRNAQKCEHGTTDDQKIWLVMASR